MPKKTDDLTNLSVKNAKPGSDRREVPDHDVKGLYLVIQTTGTKSWAIRYRQDDKPKKATIGNYPDMALKDARIEGRKFLAALTVKKARTTGNDPFETALEDFFARYVRVRIKNPLPVEQNFQHDVLPVWQGRAIGDITRADVRDLLDVMLQRGVAAKANVTFARMRKFFNWCVEREILTASPMDKMTKPADQKNRDRVLRDEELRLVWLAAETIGYPYGSAVQALILTAQRKNEVGHMERSELHDHLGDQDEPHWIIPKERTKNKQEHVVPLTPAMVRLLEDQPKLAGKNDWLIFHNRDQERIDGWGSAKKKLDAMMLLIAQQEADKRGEDAAAIELQHWTLHDLRRTAATNMGALLVDPHVIEAILNHISTGVIKGVARTYNRYAYYAQKYEAFEKWANRLERIINPTPKVVKLRAA